MPQVEHGFEKMRLPIRQTLRSALAIVTERWATLFNALLVPALLTILLNFGFRFGLDMAIGSRQGGATTSLWIAVYIFAGLPLFFLGQGALSTVFAVSCHRIALLDVTGLPRKWGLYWSYRETRFFGWLLLLGIPVVLASATFSLVSPHVIKMLSIETPFPDATAWGWRALLHLLPIGVTAVVTATFGLVLPVTAIDKKASLRLASRQVSGNILRLIVVLAIPVLLYWGVSQATYGLLAGAGDKVMIALFQLGSMLVGAFEVIVLSVSYQKLVNSNGHATHGIH